MVILDLSTQCIGYSTADVSSASVGIGAVSKRKPKLKWADSREIAQVHGRAEISSETKEQDIRWIGGRREPISSLVRKASISHRRRLWVVYNTPFAVPQHTHTCCSQVRLYWSKNNSEEGMSMALNDGGSALREDPVQLIVDTAGNNWNRWEEIASNVALGKTKIQPLMKLCVERKWVLEWVYPYCTLSLTCEMKLPRHIREESFLFLNLHILNKCLSFGLTTFPSKDNVPLLLWHHHALPAKCSVIPWTKRCLNCIFRRQKHRMSSYHTIYHQRSR